MSKGKILITIPLGNGKKKRERFLLKNKSKEEAYLYKEIHMS